VFVNRKNSPCFIAEIDGQPCAAGALAIHEGWPCLRAQPQCLSSVGEVCKRRFLRRDCVLPASRDVILR
jgi:hypothetical protein